MAGGVVSCTVTVNEHCAVLWAASVAVQFTVVTPIGQVVPETGLQFTVAEPQVSVAVGVV
jgi:hypothetical protein